MVITIITLFPEVFEAILNTSILKRAQTKSKVSFELINLRKFGEGRHQVVDDRPYGGGAGMVLKPDVLSKALKFTKSERSVKFSKVVLMSASGILFKQKKAQEFSKLNHIIIICGHYEGVDQRFIDRYVDEEISIGDYVLTGGEIPAMVIVDSVVRLIPGVLEKVEATQNESFSDSSLITHLSRAESRDHSSILLEYPHYTRPEVFEGAKVPDVLLSGNHQEIEKWKREKSREKTKRIRPDLL